MYTVCDSTTMIKKYAKSLSPHRCAVWGLVSSNVDILVHFLIQRDSNNLETRVVSGDTFKSSLRYLLRHKIQI